MIVSNGYYTPHTSNFETDSQQFQFNSSMQYSLPLFFPPPPPSSYSLLDIYVNMTCGPITFPFGSWSAWQSHGQDTNSVSFFPSPFSNLYLCIYFLFCLYLLFDFSYIIVSVQPLSTLQEQAKYLNTLAQATSKGWVTIDLTKPGLLSVDSPVVSFLPSLPLPPTSC